jgi:hypothetical protein
MAAVLYGGCAICAVETRKSPLPPVLMAGSSGAGYELDLAAPDFGRKKGPLT